MKHYAVTTATLLLLTLVIILPGCKDPDKPKGNFTVNIIPYVGSQAMTLNTTYNDGADKEFYFSKFKFYLAHVKLIKADNSEVEITDVAFYDLGDNNWKSFNANADAGTYKGIKFFVGLDPTQNATNPSDYDEDEPLGPKEDMFWDWQKHRFIVLEGRADTIGQNFSNSKGLAYHVGTDVTYREVVLTGSDIVVDGNKAINLNVDLLKVFVSAPAPVNLVTQPATQSEGADLPIANQFADQFSKAFVYTE